MVDAAPSNQGQIPPEDHAVPASPLAPSRLRWGAWSTLAWLVAVILVGAGMEMLTEMVLGKAEVATEIVNAVGKLTTIGVLFVAAYFSRRPVAHYLGLVRPRPGHLGAIVVVGVVGLATGPLIWSVLSPALGHPISRATTGIGLTATLIGWARAGFLAPITEELLCRGFLYRGFAESRLGAPGAIVLTAALFTSFHLPEFDGNSVWYLDVLRITVIGLLFAWLRERTGSIVPTWIIHTLNNAVEVPTALHIAAFQ
jgi:membrane protease YdiL (CAAX protease family)